MCINGRRTRTAQAVAVLAGSSACALSEALGRTAGLERTVSQAQTFYGVVALGLLWWRGPLPDGLACAFNTVSM